MKIAEYTILYSNSGEKSFLLVVRNVPWHIYFWNWIWETVIDPCSKRRVLWFWDRLVRIELDSFDRYDRCPSSWVSVTEDWARENYDYDINIDGPED